MYRQQARNNTWHADCWAQIHLINVQKIVMQSIVLKNKFIEKFTCCAAYIGIGGMRIENEPRH